MRRLVMRRFVTSRPVTWWLWFVAWPVVLLAGCRGGAAGRAAALPQPTDMAQWLAIAVFVVGLWWLAFKIMGR
jgi:hypothetical protein